MHVWIRYVRWKPPLALCVHVHASALTAARKKTPLPPKVPANSEQSANVFVRGRAESCKIDLARTTRALPLCPSASLRGILYNEYMTHFHGAHANKGARSWVHALHIPSKKSHFCALQLCETNFYSSARWILLRYHVPFAAFKKTGAGVKLCHNIWCFKSLQKIRHEHGCKIKIKSTPQHHVRWIFVTHAFEICM